MKVLHLLQLVTEFDSKYWPPLEISMKPNLRDLTDLHLVCLNELDLFICVLEK